MTDANNLAQEVEEHENAAEDGQNSFKPSLDEEYSGYYTFQD